MNVLMLTTQSIDSLLTFDQKQDLLKHLVKDRKFYFVMYHDLEFVTEPYVPKVVTKLHFTIEDCFQEFIQYIRDTHFRRDVELFEQCSCKDGFDTDTSVVWNTEQVFQHFCDHGHYNIISVYELKTISI